MKLMEGITYTEELLKEITRCARTLMTPSMVSFRLGIDEVQLHDDINTLGHPARRAYYMGLDETDKELRQQQLDLMRAGSPSAIADCQQRIERILNEITV